MAVHDPERVRTRSALRYRPLAADVQASPGPVVSRAYRTRMTTAPMLPGELDQEEHTSGRHGSVPALSRPALPVLARRRVHSLVLVGLGLVIALLFWAGISWLVNWGTNEMNTVKYGDPRTFQVDAVVGHSDNAEHPSHFVAINLHGTVTILEFPAGDANRARILATVSILGANSSQAVVTLTFIDISHNGHPDMFINSNGIESVLVNDGTTFRLPTSKEQQLLLFAQQHS